MDAHMYNAAMKGNNIRYGDFSLVDHLKREEEIGYQVTPKGNTILHLAALFGQRNCVEEVLKISPALLCYKNNKNETALHIAAKEGKSEVVRKLLSTEGKERLVRMQDDIGDTALHKAVRSGHIHIVRMQDDIGDTALHKAVRSGHIHIVRILMKLLLDPEHDFPANKAKETPLYLAAESGFHNALKEILKVCREPTHVAGPINRTPLHAAVIQEHTECAMALLQWKGDLCEEYDVWGWNSLHYAVKQGLTEIVSDMLRLNKSLAYDRAGSQNEWTTAFHIAASEGHEEIIHELLRHCPDCWDMVDSNGQNALHVAILNDGELMVKLLREFRFCDSLVDEADNDGNTPLHLLAAYGNHVPELILEHPRAKKMAFNRENKTPLDIAASRTSFPAWTTTKEIFMDDLLGINARLGQRCDTNVKRRIHYIGKIEETRKDDDDEEKAKKEKLEMEKIMKSTQMHVVVATLIMTVTFSAAFTLPGGLDSDDGMAILIKNAAFGAFVISDVLAFTCSACAIIIYFFMADSEVDVYKKTKVKDLLRNYRIASALQVLAMGAVVVAFVTGAYATLAKSLPLAVTVCVCVIGSVSLLIYYLVSTTKREMKLLKLLHTLYSTVVTLFD